MTKKQWIELAEKMEDEIIDIMVESNFVGESVMILLRKDGTLDEYCNNYGNGIPAEYYHLEDWVDVLHFEFMHSSGSNEIEEQDEDCSDEDYESYVNEWKNQIRQYAQEEFDRQLDDYKDEIFDNLEQLTGYDSGIIYGKESEECSVLNWVGMVGMPCNSVIGTMGMGTIDNLEMTDWIPADIRKVIMSLATEEDSEDENEPEIDTIYEDDDCYVVTFCGWA